MDASLVIRTIAVMMIAHIILSQQANAPIPLDVETGEWAQLELASMARISPAEPRTRIYFRAFNASVEDTTSDESAISGLACADDPNFYCGLVVEGPAYLIIELKSLVRTRKVPEECQGIFLVLYREDDREALHPLTRHVVGVTELNVNDDIFLSEKFRMETHAKNTTIALFAATIHSKCLGSLVAFPPDLTSAKKGAIGHVFTFGVKKVTAQARRSTR